MDRAVPVTVERRDQHPGLIVPFKDDVQAFFPVGDGRGSSLSGGGRQLPLWRAMGARNDSSKRSSRRCTCSRSPRMLVWPARQRPRTIGWVRCGSVRCRMVEPCDETGVDRLPRHVEARVPWAGIRASVLLGNGCLPSAIWPRRQTSGTTTMQRCTRSTHNETRSFLGGSGLVYSVHAGIYQGHATPGYQVADISTSDKPTGDRGRPVPYGTGPYGGTGCPWSERRPSSVRQGDPGPTCHGRPGLFVSASCPRPG